ncbi:hypothetical protein ScPMuIL_010267 [Solemya velum]
MFRISDLRISTLRPQFWVCQKLNEGVYGIVGVSNSSALATIQSYSNTFKVPFVTLSFAHNFTTPASFQLFMRPINTDAITDLLQFHRWTQLIYLYNSDEGLMRLQELFQALNLREYQLEINVKRVSDTASCLAMLREVYLRSPVHKINILLDFPIEKADKLLMMLVQAPNIDLGRFHIILADLDVIGIYPYHLTYVCCWRCWHDISQTGVKKIREVDVGEVHNVALNVTGFQLVYCEGDNAYNTADTWASSGTVHMNQKQKHILCQEALTIDAVELFTRAIHSYLLKFKDMDRETLPDDDRHEALPLRCTDSAVVQWTNRTPLVHIMKNISFQGLTGDVAFDENGFRKDFSLDIIELSPSNEVQKIGYWTPKDRLFYIHQSPAYRKRTRRF